MKIWKFSLGLLTMLVFLFGWRGLLHGSAPGAFGGAVQLALAQAEDANPESSPEETSAAPIPEQEIPGDTTILLIAAIVLVLIVLFGVFWRSRK